MTASQIWARVKLNLNRTDEGIDDRIKEWVNDRQHTICREFNFHFTEIEQEAETVSGQRSYKFADIAPAYKEELKVDLKTSAGKWLHLKKSEVRDLEQRKQFKDTTETGTPTHYYVWQDAFYLFPIPDKAYTLNLKYFSYLTDLSTGTDTNGLTIHYPNVLIYAATGEGFAYFEDNEATMKYETKYANELRKMISQQVNRSYANLDLQIKPRTKYESVGYQGG